MAAGPPMKLENDDRRRHERFQVALQVELPSAHGVTHDLSLSGVYFESPMTVDVGSKIEFTVILANDLRLRCEGTVIRVTPSDTGNGVAARMDVLECAPAGGIWH